MKPLLIFLLVTCLPSFACDLIPDLSYNCEPTQEPLQKIFILDGEETLLTRVCSYDLEDRVWSWQYRNYNLPGTCYPEDG